MYVITEGKGGRKRERETSVGCLSHAPARDQPVTGNQTQWPFLRGTILNQPSHTAQS